MQIPITDRIIKVMGTGRVFKDQNSARINSIDFHRTEDFLVTASDDDSIHVYDVASGVCQQTLYSKKYGVANINFTHSQDAVVYATRKAAPTQPSQQPDFALRYHDLRRNEYMRYYRGHTHPITSLCMNPRTDLFMSASLDKTVRLWDLRVPQCQGVLHVPSQPTAAFDQQGLVFGVGVETGMIKLYDARSYDKGPFDTFVITDEVNGPATFSDLKFSPDGKLMLAVCEGKVYLLDAYTGQVQKRLATSSTTQELSLSNATVSMEACFSADNQYVLSGCEDRSIRVWSVATGAEVAAWQGHAGTPACIKWAHRRLLVASACQALCLWLPNLSALDGSI